MQRADFVIRIKRIKYTVPQLHNRSLTSPGRVQNNIRTRFIWRALRARYRDQKAELAAIKSTIQSNGIAVDVGANKGSYLYWLARWVPDGKAVAFEPQEELAQYLRAAATTIPMKNVVVEAKGSPTNQVCLNFFHQVARFLLAHHSAVVYRIVKNVRQ